ncbi:MAG TPA: methyltransferase domain-containing protein [Vicinamibacteria bacterium]|nr:methyltransferase domain-containing protein [Vicinamibacteria bacterium]
MSEDALARWLAALEARHLRDLTFQEVRRALQALSSTYVQRRGRLAQGAALEGAGKRAAFALFYGPLHFLTVREVVRALGAAGPAPSEVLDLGCGPGAAGAAWAREARPAPPVHGVDRSGWAVDEARWTLRQLGLRGTVAKGDAKKARLPRAGGAVLAAYTLNELDEGPRERLLDRLFSAAGVSVLVVEPIAVTVSPWWSPWAARVAAAGGRADEWRFRVPLPDLVARLDRAARLDHRQLTARSLWLPRFAVRPSRPR